MFKENSKIAELNNSDYSIKFSSKAEKLTALWALSESALGGVLHAFKFPFRGMIISGAAVILISLIARFSDKKGQIVKSTLLVIFIKAVISPHTPITAYLAVFLQGLFGELYFLSRRFQLFSALLLGITASLFNGFQKIIVLTIIYGNTLWQTLNDFIKYIADELLVISLSDSINFSNWLISIYVGIHLAAGIIAGLLAYRISNIVSEKLNQPEAEIDLIVQNNIKDKSYVRRKRKWLKPSSIIIFSLSILIIFITYFFPESERFDVSAIIIMLVRSVLIILVWFNFLAPQIKKLLRNYLTKNHNRYSKDIESIVSAIPTLKIIIVSVWKHSAKLKGIKKIDYFFINTLVYILRDYK